jgi:hypothetical protein
LLIFLCWILLANTLYTSTYILTNLTISKPLFCLLCSLAFSWARQSVLTAILLASSICINLRIRYLKSLANSVFYNNHKESPRLPITLHSFKAYLLSIWNMIIVSEAGISATYTKASSLFTKILILLIYRIKYVFGCSYNRYRLFALLFGLGIIIYKS